MNNSDTPKYSFLNKKGAKRIIVGLILVILQILSIAGTMMKGSMPVFNTSSFPMFMYSFGYYAGFLAIGIIGVVLLIIGSVAFRKNQ